MVECSLIGPLVTFAEVPIHYRRVQLAAFLAKLLQPELHELAQWNRQEVALDPPWSQTFSSGPVILEAARGASANLREALERHGPRIWALLATVPSTGPVQLGFLRDCSELAFLFPGALAEDGCRILLQACIAGTAALTTLEAGVIAALCVLAANAGLGPTAGADDGGLTAAVIALPSETRVSTCAVLIEWPGPALRGTLACWSAYLQGAALPATVEDVPAAPAPALGGDHQAALGMSGLRKAMSQAPPELCCALDGRLLTNPVRAPSGHVYEQLVLVWTLASNGGRCPATGQPLCLSDCSRDAELQARAVQWSREQRR